MEETVKLDQAACQAPEMALSAFYDSFALDCFALGVVGIHSGHFVVLVVPVRWRDRSVM